MSYGKGVIEGDTTPFLTKVIGSCDDALEISFRDCERRSFTNVPTFSLPMWTNYGLSPVKWCEFSPSQLGTTAIITDSIS